MLERTMPDQPSPRRQRIACVVIAGMGWLGCAKSTLRSRWFRVTWIVGMVDPTGSQQSRTKSGKPFEAGTKDFGRTIQHQCLSEISTLALFSLTLQQVLFCHAEWIGSGLLPVFWRAARSGQAPWSSDGTVNNFKATFRFKIDSASQDFSTAMLDLYPSDEVNSRNTTSLRQSLFGTT